MTETTQNRPLKRLFRRHRLMPRLTLLLFLLMLLPSDSVSSALSDGLLLCAKTVIPALFPFLVLSEAMVSFGVMDLPARLLRKPMQSLGISGEGGCAWLLGVLCGFPIGTRYACALYQKGNLSRTELEYLLCFCNLPSSAFLIHAVGASLFGSHRFGMWLYGTVLFSSLLCAILFRLLFFHALPLPTAAIASAPKSAVSSFSVLTEAVTHAADGMLRICAFVVFFSAVSGVIASLPLPYAAQTLLYGALEMTGGMEAASHMPRYAAMLLAAAFGGWSGLSVHLQLKSILPNASVRMMPYFVAKLTQSAICTLLMAISCAFLPTQWLFPLTDSPVAHFSFPMLRAPILLLFFFSTLCLFFSSCRSRKHFSQNPQKILEKSRKT